MHSCCRVTFKRRHSRRWQEEAHPKIRGFCVTSEGYGTRTTFGYRPRFVRVEDIQRRRFETTSLRLISFSISCVPRCRSHERCFRSPSVDIDRLRPLLFAAAGQPGLHITGRSRRILSILAGFDSRGAAAFVRAMNFPLLPNAYRKATHRELLIIHIYAWSFIRTCHVPNCCHRPVLFPWFLPSEVQFPQCAS
jgi:hypothetical protein